MRAREAALASNTVVRARCGKPTERRNSAAAGEGSDCSDRRRAITRQHRIILVRIFARDFLVIGAGRGAIARTFGQPPQEIQRGGSVLRSREQTQVRAEQGRRIRLAPQVMHPGNLPMAVGRFLGPWGTIRNRRGTAAHTDRSCSRSGSDSPPPEAPASRNGESGCRRPSLSASASISSRLFRRRALCMR